jgi:hypothetical protein
MTGDDRFSDLRRTRARDVDMQNTCHHLSSLAARRLIAVLGTTVEDELILDALRPSVARSMRIELHPAGGREICLQRERALNGAWPKPATDG